MSWKAESDEQCGAVFLAFWGDISREDVRESSATVTAMLCDTDTRKILTDFSHATSLAASTVDIYRLPDVYRSLGLEGPFTEAVVAPNGGGIREDTEFYETVCVNRGLNVQVFKDRDRALKWLSR